MEIFRAKTRLDAAENAAETLTRLLKANKDSKILLLLSGGSALEILDFIDEDCLGENLTLSVIDERFSADPKVNNFAQIQDTAFYALAQDKGASFIGTLPRPGETLSQISLRFEGALKKWREENPRGKMFATLGMGADGHTAGIFPLPENKPRFNQLFASQNWVAGYDNQGQKMPPQRFTATLTLLAQLDSVVVFVTGEEKWEKLRLVLKKSGEVHQLPAQAWHKLKAVQIYTDMP